MSPPSRVYRPRPDLLNWFVDVRLRSGARLRMSGFRSEGLTRDLARRIEDLDDCRAAGRGLSPEMVEWLGRLPDRMLRQLERKGLVGAGEIEQTRTIEEHLADWEEHLGTRGSTEQHVEQTTKRARAVLDGIGAVRWGQVRPHEVEVWLSRFREGKVAIEGPREREEKRERSLRTSNAYLAALRQFCRWAVKQGRLQADPIASVEPLDARRDLKKRRRALALDEQRKLLASVRKGKVRGQRIPATGDERALAYRLALECALRRDEIASLRVGQLELDAEPPRIIWRGTEVKGRREQVVPLRVKTAELLAAECTGKLPSARIFPWFPGASAALRWLRDDLAAAGIEAVDEHGREVDWHALRKSSGTLFQRVGRDLDATARFLRHGDARTTRAHYLDDDVPALGQLLEALPDLEPDDDEGEEVALSVAPNPAQ